MQKDVKHIYREGINSNWIQKDIYQILCKETNKHQLEVKVVTRLNNYEDHR